MKEQMSKAILYVHGKGGSADEADRYKPLFPSCEVIAIDYKSDVPWEAGKEIGRAVADLRPHYDETFLIANSIGAFFSMHASVEKMIDKAFFISPIVDMEKLIRGMMSAANISEEELQLRGKVSTGFGEDLSWEYLTFAKEHPAAWSVPTEILYGNFDTFTDFETISAFSDKIGARLTVMKGGEHWFHTDEQFRFLDRWITSTMVQSIPE